jgi:hypothetical protein
MPLGGSSSDGVLAGDARHPPFVRIDKLERTLPGTDVDVASPAHLRPDSGQLQDVVRFRSHGFHN